MEAVGIHVFAGGFTMGVKRAGFDVKCQLEVHNFGLETAEQVAKVPTVNCEDYRKWPDVRGQFAFGNPRCTGFSTITSGYGEDTHGAFAKQTCDIQQFCEYTAGRFDVAIWESVQQAYTTGRPLLDWAIREHYAPKGYRIAHVFVNAASFGNVQQRKRYFFVAYRDDRNFNVTPPSISPTQPVLYDVLWKLRDRVTREAEDKSEYDFDTYLKLTDNEKAAIPFLPNGWGLNTMGRYAHDLLPRKFQEVWDMRCSDMPFSLHCVSRTNWLRPCPTLHSSANRYIHPHFHRPLTVGELATIMGWPDIPRGKMPVPQIAKGICPEVGEWLGHQAAAYLRDDWGSEDWESSYVGRDGEWRGGDTHGAREKVFDLTQYCGQLFDLEDYPTHDPLLQPHRLDVARRRVRV